MSAAIIRQLRSSKNLSQEDRKCLPHRCRGCKPDRRDLRCRPMRKYMDVSYGRNLLRARIVEEEGACCGYAFFCRGIDILHLSRASRCSESVAGFDVAGYFVKINCVSVSQYLRQVTRRALKEDRYDSLCQCPSRRDLSSDPDALNTPG